MIHIPSITTPYQQGQGLGKTRCGGGRDASSVLLTAAGSECARATGNCFFRMYKLVDPYVDLLSHTEIPGSKAVKERRANGYGRRASGGLGGEAWALC